MASSSPAQLTAALCPRAFSKTSCTFFIPTQPCGSWKGAGLGSLLEQGPLCLEWALQSLPGDATWGWDLDTTKFSHSA